MIEYETKLIDENIKAYKNIIKYFNARILELEELKEEREKKVKFEYKFKISKKQEKKCNLQ